MADNLHCITYQYILFGESCSSNTLSNCLHCSKLSTSRLILWSILWPQHFTGTSNLSFKATMNKPLRHPLQNICPHGRWNTAWWISKQLSHGLLQSTAIVLFSAPITESANVYAYVSLLNIGSKRDNVENAMPYMSWISGTLSGCDRWKSGIWGIKALINSVGLHFLITNQELVPGIQDQII